MPTEQVIPSFCSTLALINFAIVWPSPSRRRAPVTSRNASSNEIGSTSGVMSWKILITLLETSSYRSISGEIKIACGANALAL